MKALCDRISCSKENIDANILASILKGELVKFYAHSSTHVSECENFLMVQDPANEIAEIIPRHRLNNNCTQILEVQEKELAV